MRSISRCATSLRPAPTTPNLAPSAALPPPPPAASATHPTPTAAPAPRTRRDDLVPRERAARRGEVRAGPARLLAARLVVLREDERLVLTGALEPLAREAVTERTIGVGEHRVRGVAQERMPERVLTLAAELPLAAPCDDLALHELIQPLLELRGARAAAEQRRGAAVPQHFAEAARRPKDPPRRDVERLEPRLGDREDRLGQRIAASFGNRARELLEQERGAGRA